MSVTGPNTGFKTTYSGSTQDLGERYVSKDYLIDVYPNIASTTGNITLPGLWVWGLNSSFGHLGLNDVSVSRSSPTQVGSLAIWKSVAGGSQHMLAVETDGSLWAWGRATVGETGLNSTVHRSSPVQVGSLTDWKQVACSVTASFAVKTNGSLWSWGQNTNGILGIGTTTPTSRSSPAQVGSLTNWKSVSGGGQNSPGHCVAIKTDGTLWAWGKNSDGELGLADTVHRSSPVQVGSLTTWKDVACGDGHTIALQTNGTLWAWGRNGSQGQLGLGVLGHRSSPVQVGSLTSWYSIGVGQNYSFGIRTDGTLWAWGSGGNGRLGDGTITDKSSPVQIGTLTNWKKVVGADQHSLALKTDGTLWAWGQSTSGQTGLNSISNVSSPVQVGTLTNWRSVYTNLNLTSMAIADGYY
jgi:alpha-tubulin suppressor-like RCC1 family protein